MVFSIISHTSKIDRDKVTKQTVLIVDDEPDLVELLSYNLQAEGYRVRTALNGEAAISIALEEPPEMFVLDVMMPGMSGLECCQLIRESPVLKQIPVLMLTALSSDGDHVQGLDAGADIYLSKPVSIPVFLSQVKAVLRREKGDTEESNNSTIRVGGITIDRLRYLVLMDDGDYERPFRLPRKEFELLSFMASHPDRVFSRQELLDHVWGSEVFVVDRTIDVHIRKLREKLGFNYFETVKGIGYSFRIPDQ